MCIGHLLKKYPCIMSQRQFTLRTNVILLTETYDRINCHKFYIILGFSPPVDIGSINIRKPFEPFRLYLLYTIRNIVTIMAYSRLEVLSTYRALLREAKSFGHYNFREYFVRKTRAQFRANAKLVDQDNTELLNEAKRDLEVLKRQASISNMYHVEKLVVETL